MGVRRDGGFDRDYADDQIRKAKELFKAEDQHQEKVVTMKEKTLSLGVEHKQQPKGGEKA